MSAIRKSRREASSQTQAQESTARFHAISKSHYHRQQKFEARPSFELISRHTNTAQKEQNMQNNHVSTHS